MNKEQLISQNQWDLFRNKPYENYTVQATQHTTLNRSIQAMDDMETNERSARQSQAGPAEPEKEMIMMLIKA